ncbi:MAG: hypothetical protein ACOY45_00495 [Pseudomonadota bacterium]
MTFVSRAALAIAMSLGVVAVSSPAMAQKAKDKDAPKLQVSNEFRKPAAAAEAAIKAKDYATAETELAKAEAIAKNDDERYFAASMRLQVEAGKKSTDGIIKALDLLLANPKTPRENLAFYNFLRGAQTMEQKKSAEAIPFLEKARELGSAEKDLPLLLARAYIDTGKVKQGVGEIDRAIQIEKAAGRKPPEDWYSYAVSKLYNSGDRAATGEWLMRQVGEYPSLANWRKVILIYRDSKNAAGESLTGDQKLDLFRLMRATGALQDQGDYFDYANGALLAGLPWETIVIIDEGRKNGRVPKPQASFDKAYGAAQTAVRNEGSLDALAKNAQGSANGKPAVATGDAFLSSANYARAVEMYQLALQKGGVDTNAVNLHLGVSYARLGKMDEAKSAFGKVAPGTLGDIAHFWLVWMDMPALAAAAPAAN